MSWLHFPYFLWPKRRRIGLTNSVTLSPWWRHGEHVSRSLCKCKVDFEHTSPFQIHFHGINLNVRFSTCMCVYLCALWDVLCPKTDRRSVPIIHPHYGRCFFTTQVYWLLEEGLKDTLIFNLCQIIPGIIQRLLAVWLTILSYTLNRLHSLFNN